MRNKSKYYNLIFGFLIGFSLSIIGMAIEDIQFQIPIKFFLRESHHLYAPIIIGVLTSIMGYFYWRRTEKEVGKQLKSKQSLLILNEYKYRTLFENMNDIVCMLDLNKKIIDVNKAAIEFYEYSKDELLNLSVKELVHNEDSNISNTFFEKLENSGSYNMYEGRVITKSGRIKWIQVNSTEIVHNGEKIGSQDIIRDITQRKNIEIELQQTIKKLNQLVETRDKLFSIIAHDLKSPFNSILGFSEILGENLKNYDIKKSEKIIKIINSTAKNTFTLLDNLLNWTKMQSGKIIFKPQKLILSTILKEIIKISTSAATLKNIQLNFIQSKDIEVFADENMLNAVLRNLISNAIKFTNTGGNISISTISKQHQVEITISDNGVGISKETSKNLFNISTNITSVGTENERGSGLGLVLCKEFIEKNNGKIWVESEEGKGSDFKFTLPIYESK